MAKAHRAEWLRVDRLLGEHGIQQDSAAGRRQFEERMEQRRRTERIIREELKRLRWTENDLKLRAKSGPAKLALAARVRRETTQTLGWIAHRVHLGTRKSFNAKLHRWRKAQEKVS